MIEKQEFQSQIIEVRGRLQSIPSTQALIKTNRFLLGDFAGNPNGVIPLDLIEGAVGRDVQPLGRTVWGVDVARFGEDRTALCKRRANALLEPVRAWQGKDTMQTAGLLKLEYEAEKRKPDVIFVDVSGSMSTTPISKYSTLYPKDIATLYGAILNSITENAVIGAFASDFALVRAPGKDIFGTKDAIDRINVGGNTNAWKAFEWLREERVKAYRVFLFSEKRRPG